MHSYAQVISETTLGYKPRLYRNPDDSNKSLCDVRAMPLKIQALLTQSEIPDPLNLQDVLSEGEGALNYANIFNGGGHGGIYGLYLLSHDVDNLGEKGAPVWISKYTFGYGSRREYYAINAMDGRILTTSSEFDSAPNPHRTKQKVQLLGSNEHASVAKKLLGDFKQLSDERYMAPRRSRNDPSPFHLEHVFKPKDKPEACIDRIKAVLPNDLDSSSFIFHCCDYDVLRSYPFQATPCWTIFVEHTDDQNVAYIYDIYFVNTFNGKTLSLFNDQFSQHFPRGTPTFPNASESFGSFIVAD